MLYFRFIYYFFVISRFSFFQQNVRIHDWGTHAEISTHNMDRYRLSKLIIHINLEFGKLFEIYYGVTVTMILENPWYKICVYSRFMMGIHICFYDLSKFVKNSKTYSYYSRVVLLYEWQGKFWTWKLEAILRKRVQTDAQITNDLSFSVISCWNHVFMW